MLTRYHCDGILNSKLVLFLTFSSSLEYGNNLSFRDFPSMRIFCFLIQSWSSGTSLHFQHPGDRNMWISVSLRSSLYSGFQVRWSYHVVRHCLDTLIYIYMQTCLYTQPNRWVGNLRERWRAEMRVMQRIHCVAVRKQRCPLWLTHSEECAAQPQFSGEHPSHCRTYGGPCPHR